MARREAKTRADSRGTSDMGAAHGVAASGRKTLVCCAVRELYLPQAGEKRIEWYRYGDSNPGYKVENLVS